MAHKHSVILDKAQVEFFVKKAGKSFGVDILDSKGNQITKLYGSLGRKIRNSTVTIGEFIDGEKLVFDAPERSRKARKDSKVEKKAGRGVRKDFDSLAKNIAKAFAEFVE